MELSRLFVTGPLNDNTPIDVLYEIIQSHSYDRSKEWIFSNYTSALQLCRTTYCSISQPIERKDYPVVARFLNHDPTVVWTPKTLLAALSYLMNHREIPSKPIMGQQCPSHIESLNACMLYYWCTRFHILLHRNTTNNQMFRAVLSLQQPREVLLQHLLTVDVCTLASLITLGEESTEAHCERSVDSKALEVEYKELNRVTTLRKRLTPRDKLEAVALAALNYTCDISHSTNPVSDYLALTRETDRRLEVDINFRAFNSLFPPCYYTPALLDTLLQQEGFLPSDLRGISAYNKLKESTLIDNFYSASQLRCLPTVRHTAIYHTDINTLSNDSILYYGCIGDINIAYTLDELGQHFTNALSFSNPLTKETLSPHNVRKLKRICALSGEAGNKCLSAMREAELYNTKVSGRTNEFLQYYRSSSSAKREEVDNILNVLLHLAMHMRGWDGESKELPVAIAINNDDVRTDIKVHENIVALRSKCKEAGNIGGVILQLPLFCYRNGDYRASADREDGLTLDARLDIICAEERALNPNACIRLSSNWLAASAHRYITLLAKPEPFDIRALANIS